jgi:hypothetical protein
MKPLSALHAFWRSDCAPLPESSTGLSVVARCDLSRWSRVQERVKRAINELTPKLTAVYAQAHKAAKGKREIGRLGGLASVAKRKQKVQPSADKVSSPALNPQRGISPPSQLPQPAARKARPRAGIPAALLSDQRPPALPMQPVRMAHLKSAAARGTPCDKSGARRLTD